MTQYAVDWLMENAGPVIKYRTSLELQGVDDSKLEAALLKCGLVKMWLSNVQPSFGATELHSSKPTAFENAMGRLYELGLRKGHKPLDDRVKPFLDKLEELALSKGKDPDQSWFHLSLMAGYLAMTGYSSHHEVEYIIKKRLDTVHEFTLNGDLSNAYIDPETVGTIPSNFRNRPILNPNLWGTRDRYEKGSLLPSIHDIHGFLHSEPVFTDKETQMKVEKVVEFILSPEYQSLEPGYGVIYEPETRKFFGAGWSIHLKDYFDTHPRAERMKKNIGVDSANLLRLSLFSRSQTGRGHRWFREQIAKLEEYRTNGLYQIPRSLLEDRKTGYWVAGRSLGLEENRRTSRAITAESTFRLLEIRNPKPFAS